MHFNITDTKHRKNIGENAQRIKKIERKKYERKK